MKTISQSGEVLQIPLGDFALITLDRENPMNSSARRHIAYVRYNGLNQGVAHLEIGEYDGKKEHQEGRLIYFPKDGDSLNYRINTGGLRVKFKDIIVTGKDFTAEDSTERQTAIRD
jgi:hypothetical protein